MILDIMLPGCGGVELPQTSEGKLEAHQYLNALKAGKLRESAMDSERFLKYRAKYMFPEE